MRQHAIAGAVAAVIAAGTSAGLDISKGPRQTVTHSVNVSKHAWPDLSDSEKAALAVEVAWLKGASVIVMCDGADCRDLQTDIDDAFEDAGISSTRDRPFVPLGYGISVVAAPDDARGSRLAGVLKAATGGRLDAKVEAHDSARGVLIVAIGKRPRS